MTDIDPSDGPAGPAAGGMGRLLVVDDDPQFLRLIAVVAGNVGYVVETAVNADEFSRKLQSFAPTLIMSDIVMPEVDGVELAYWLSTEGCDVPIILITGYNPLYAKAAMDLSAKGALNIIATLSKPIDIEDLERLLTSGAASAAGRRLLQ
jgi:CheY-like chemotaxis protein